jgi:hypothetical protein
MLLGCVYSRKVWARMLQSLGWGHVLPVADSSLGSWWVREGKRIAKPRRRAFDSLVLLVARKLWLERNGRVFNRNATLLA